MIVYANGQQLESSSYTVSSIGIQLPGYIESSFTPLALMALDSNGYPFISTFPLLFGCNTLKVTLNDANGSPVANVPVEANTTQFDRFTQTLLTDESGQASFTNLPATTIGLLARTPDNQIAVAGIASELGFVTMQLIPFNQPSDEDNFDFSNGSDGWTGGTIISHVAKRHVASRRAYEARNRLAKRTDLDLDLEVGTNGQFDLQTASATFKTYPFTKTVFLKFKFQTNEIPGGYFGSQYNDYFVVTIRADTGELAIMTNSMNALGLGAFDGSDATD